MSHKQPKLPGSAGVFVRLRLPEGSCREANHADQGGDDFVSKIQTPLIKLSVPGEQPVSITQVTTTTTKKKKSIFSHGRDIVFC